MSDPQTPSDLGLCLSPLPHLWLIDIDGTLVTHNGHLSGQECLLDGVQDFWQAIPPGDTIVLLSARQSVWREPTLAWLAAQGLRFNQALFDLPTGERILINDKKDSGLATALALNLKRDAGPGSITVMIDSNL
ncbi:MAG: hypothetical protein PHH58_07520 [Rhodoferax sp.]|nr:hypothetical protein [Rhodoferax sp.]